MAHFKFRLSHHAVADLEGIAEYLRHRSPGAACRVVDALHNTFEMLADNNQLGTSVEEIRADLRMFIPFRPADKYVVLYYQVPDGVLISDVIHSARDWPGMFASGER
jgi:plasmid stabilization system protein ParE